MNPLDSHKEPFFNIETPEVRSIEGGPTTVFGYYAVFGVRSQEMRTAKGVKFVEIIEPGTFDGCDDSDVECKFNHKTFLAATPTLEMGVDQRGAWYSYQHDPLDPDHVSTLRKIQRGEAAGSSFEFDPPGPDDQTVTKEGELFVRSIRKIRKKWDVGPVIKPAYRQTTAFARSLDAALNEPELPEPTETRDMSGAYDADTNPTDAQKEAGNFKKGKVRIAGMAMSIENPKDSTRSGKNAAGEEWSREMTAHYGYILGSLAGDGDNLDVFLSDEAETATVAFVVDQINQDGEFDEHKCVIGPATLDEARALYLAHYPADWTGLGAISCIPIEVFRAWAMDGKTKKLPLVYQRPDPQPELPKLYEPYTDALKTVLETSNLRQARFRQFKALHP